MQLGGRVVAVWYPTAAREKPYWYAPRFSGRLAENAPPSTACGRAVPLVVFSHGDLGCGLQSVVFTEELARNGYVVAAADHADAMLCHIVPVTPHSKLPPPLNQPSILKPEDWDDSSRADRREDVEGIIDGLLANAEFRKVIDATSIGLAGHSLGGYTVIGIAGGWPKWRDRRVRAVLALSPYVMPFQAKDTLRNVHLPLMYQGGSVDVGITPFLKGKRGAYAQARSPAYYIELPNAGHFAWVNCEREYTTATCLANVPNIRWSTAYAVAFFDRYLKRLPAPLLDAPNPALAEFDSK